MLLGVGGRLGLGLRDVLGSSEGGREILGVVPITYAIERSIKKFCFFFKCTLPLVFLRDIIKT